MEGGLPRPPAQTPSERRTDPVITRAIFVLTSPEAGEQFLRVLPDLQGIGLNEATILHLVSAQPGPAEPMPELANWVRHFEAAIPKVELALKRGDPVKWVYELARVRGIDIVVISGIPNGTDWDLSRVTSPLRTLGIPILFLPDGHFEASLAECVLVAIKGPEAADYVVAGLKDWLGASDMRAINVVGSKEERSVSECGGIPLETAPLAGDVATTLLQSAEACGASMIAILAGEDAEDEAGVPVVKPLVDTTGVPVLVWPG
jgi:hypothetical protein